MRRAYDELEHKVQERTAQLAQANDVLRTEKELFRVTLASIGDAVIATDATAHITYLNAAAERYGLMLAVDRWVVAKSVEALSTARDSGGQVTFAINISGQSLGAADFAGIRCQFRPAHNCPSRGQCRCATH